MKTSLLSALLATFALTACSSGNVQLSGSALPPSVVAPATLTAADTLALAPIALAAVSPETVQMQGELRKSVTRVSAPASTEDAAERLQIQQLIDSVQGKIAAEDAAYAAANPGDFRVKTAQQGKDVDIELFLYHPKYGSKAKSWGIDNAYEFLEAGKSPWRRWTLRLKLEGLFAPKGFSQQVLFWIEQADLLRISGVSKDQAWLLVAAGITSVPDLARRSSGIEQAALVLSLKTLGFQYGISAPNLDTFQDWVDEAQQLEPVIY
ncbi:MAG: DUF4332 domain-containing protein [Candidatus Sericytochromatia bacterium]